MCSTVLVTGDSQNKILKSQFKPITLGENRLFTTCFGLDFGKNQLLKGESICYNYEENNLKTCHQYRYFLISNAHLFTSS